MKTLQITLTVFALIETLNMLELYFLQNNCKFNGACIFSGWEKSKADPEVHALVRYLVNWLAGVKMIVIALVLVIVFTAPESTLLVTAIALIITIASFYWRLYPLLCSADKAGQLSPRGHSKRLSIMLAGLELSLVLAIVFYLFEL
ncbi:MAG: hypothetical protein HN736_01345 [Anaerolineae bacterium]|jgi:hypothetical protein|nr:hypothetical protein [Anaerolineae bacterium]MBT3713380.1 hypothetical protein [Anaerolineae bacterium]MBT4309488.1 hypothetical protein [Anaerolineae bacterium]MBT4459478.1 hypothetical protein [Anaerolineae bacterium]MBT4842402.1 hypothetical protein [Anaerolineae bacterium]